MSVPSAAASEGGALAGGPGADGHRRIVAIDLARGAAIIAMIAYHLSFDLYHFGYVDWPVTTSPGWRGFAAAIASTFLFLVGVSLVLAHARAIRWRAFLKRLAIIVAAAAAVTAVSMVALPGAPILFGILHAIALSSVIGLGFVRLPPVLTFAAGLSICVLPFLWRSATFDGLAFVWLGLGERIPPSMDYEPLFPWTGVTLFGIAFARWRGLGEIASAKPAPSAPAERDLRPGVATAPRRALAWAGRHSLVLYLVHQPVLFAVLTATIALAGPPVTAWSRSFLAECQAVCQRQRDQESCRRQCQCARDEIVARGLVPPPVIAGQRQPPPAELQAIAGICQPEPATDDAS